MDDDTGHEIAWNVIKITKLPKIDRGRIKYEVATLKSMKEHPNIIHFIAAWINKQKEEVVFITEMVTAGSLRQYLKKIKKPKLKVIKTWAIEILKGLNYLHQLDPPIIHRDIKCDNVFINSHNGEIRIGDLGLSTSLNQSFTTSVLGTPEFMAPELYDEKYGTAVDIYAFGMCFLEMCTLSTPYKECDNPAQIYKKVTEGIRPQALDLINDPEIYKFIWWCIDGRDNRPSAKEILECDFLKDLDSEVNNHPVITESKNRHKSTKHESKITELPSETVHQSTNNDTYVSSPTVQNHLLQSEQSEGKSKKSGPRKSKLTSEEKKKKQHDIMIKDQKNENESLEFFEKIEAEKNERLQIKDDMSIENDDHSPDVSYERTSDNDIVRVKVKDEKLNLSQDIIMREQHDNSMDQHINPKAFQRSNTSYENNGISLLEKQNSTDTMRTDHNSHKDQPISGEEETPNRNIVLKLVSKNIEKQQIRMKLCFISENNSREVTFDFSLADDTSERIWKELEEVSKISRKESNKIKTDIDKIVVKVQEEQIQIRRMKEAEFAISHFVKSVEGEISSIAKYQTEIEYLSQQTDSKDTTLCLQFIK